MKICTLAVVGMLSVGTLFAASPALASGSDSDPIGQEDVLELAAALDVTAETEAAIGEAYMSLSDAERDVVLETLESDPAALIEWQASSSGEVGAVALPTREDQSRSARAAKATALVAKDSKTAYMLGIPIGTWVIEYKYYATSTAVTGNIDCQGWFNGIAVSDTVRESSYIVSGRGTCSARHTMSFIFKGSPVSWNKLHTFTTKSGNPRSLSGSLTNV